MDEQRYTYRVQWLVLAGAVLLLLLLIAAWLHEGLNKEWRRHQRDYAKLLSEMGSEEEISGIADMERGIFQVELPQLDRVDRCISCHNGIEDRRMVGMPQPHAAHSGTFLDDHPVSKYGCTICHGGQGRALSVKDAFGRLPETHWPYPLLKQPYIQSSCGKCHLAIFGEPEEPGFKSGGGTAFTEGMEVFVRGKILFSREGCLGCHKARGVGGILGPDLTRQGEKTKHEYSFQNIAGEQSVSNWIKEHFRDPEMVSPGSQMLQINLAEEELGSLATFVMGLSKPDIPIDYFSVLALNEFKGVRDSMDGPTGYACLCSACHGKRGEGKDYKAYKTGVPSIGNRDFLRVASTGFIRFTMEKGRSLRQMGSWAGPVSGMKETELDKIASHLKKQSRLTGSSGFSGSGGDAEAGTALFNQHCRVCHGENGRGDVAVALNQEGFLHRADDAFIFETMISGRENTAMPGWSHLDQTDLENLLAVIRSWSNNRPWSDRMNLPEPDLAEGYRRFHFLCSRCHGEFGEGETGPSIINNDFLHAAGNKFLYETIAGGRAHSAMFGWSADVYDQEKLEVQDISNLIGYMRISAGSPLTYIFPGSNPGDRQMGAVVFKERCAECHGPSGEGIKGPALNNQEFLSAASNGYLMATMTLGRTGTGMPSWGYGQGDYPALDGRSRWDLVAYLRSLQRIRIKY
ncbi:MAG: c-type cytochrome [Bacteroidota bacterium]